MEILLNSRTWLEELFKDFFTMGLGTFAASTAELGLENIMIKGRAGGPCLRSICF